MTLPLVPDDRPRLDFVPVGGEPATAPNSRADAAPTPPAPPMPTRVPDPILGFWADEG